MEICGKYIGTDVIDRIKERLKTESSISRSSLSRQVCEWLNWRSPNGRLCEVSCRKALLELHRRKMIELPQRDHALFFKKRSVPEGSAAPRIREISCTLKELGEVEIVPVSSDLRDLSRTWNALMDAYHYLGSGPLCGAQIRYLIYSSAGELLGCLAFSAATWRLKMRDEWIGWSEKARRANLQKVVCNSRFLILPTVRVKNLASHVLSRALERLGNDWEERFAYRPVLVETFVDPKRFRGTCYLASNWVFMGETAASNTPFANGKISDGEKRIFVYALCREWQSILCAEPSVPLGSKPRPESFADWAEEEFSTVEIYDRRLRERLLQIVKDFHAQPTAAIPLAFSGSKAKIKAAYRFFANEQIDMETLLKPHKETTIERIKQHGVVLAVQDTTTLDYTAHPATEGLGPVAKKKDKNVGLVVHHTMAFTEEGTPLGLLDVQCWARDPNDIGKSEKRKELPIEEKESYKWLKSYQAISEVQALCPETQLVSVGDREADIYELFYEAAGAQGGPKLLIRAERSRQRKVTCSEEETQTEFLWTKMVQEPIAGYLEIQIPRRGDRKPRKARKANVSVRFAPVALEPPRRLKDLPAIKLWAIYLVEVDGPKEEDPIEWMLLTNVEVSTFEQAVERARWYAARWNIEVYHRILKSGCRIEDRQLNHADRLERCLAIDMVIAWRIFWLTKMGRETPNLPCDIILSEEEWKVLWACTEKKPPPRRPPSASWAVLRIANIGGFQGRKCDGDPGPTVMWRGITRLYDKVDGFRYAHLVYPPRAGP